MKRIIHITREMSTIEYDPTTPCLIDTIRDFLNFKEFKAHLNKGLELLVKTKRVHGEIGLIINTKFIAAFPEENQKWIIDDWTLRVAQNGIQHFAMVLSNDEFVCVSNDVFDETAETTLNGITYRNFRDEDSARAWLRGSLKRAVITVL